MVIPKLDTSRWQLFQTCLAKPDLPSKAFDTRVRHEHRASLQQLEHGMGDLRSEAVAVLRSAQGKSSRLVLMQG